MLAKSDADVCCVRPALESPNVELMPNTTVRRLPPTAGKRVVGHRSRTEWRTSALRQPIDVVIACGATNSALLLLRSANGKHPNGLANSSGLVGRNYMVHNNTALMAVKPFKHNRTVFQKTMAVNDFYLRGPDWPYPMGNIQMLGKLQAGMLTAAKPGVPKPILQAMADRSVDWWVMSEDLADPENRVTLDFRR